MFDLGFFRPVGFFSTRLVAISLVIISTWLDEKTRQVTYTNLSGFFFLKGCKLARSTLTVTAQTTAPADSGPNPEDPGGEPGGDPLGGGGAPIGGGTFILIGLAAAYGGRKVHKLYKDNQEELED